MSSIRKRLVCKLIGRRLKHKRPHSMVTSHVPPPPPLPHTFIAPREQDSFQCPQLQGEGRGPGGQRWRIPVCGHGRVALWKVGTGPQENIIKPF